MVFTQAIADAICERVMSGETLRQVCASEGTPSRSTVHKWLAADPIFADQYARAMAVRADDVFDEIFDIADDGQNDWMERRGADGEMVGWQENGEALRRSALRVDARKWALSKMLPKKYGDKLELAVTTPPSEGEIDAAIAAKLAAMAVSGQARVAKPFGGEGTPDQD